jgi:hypothetical protein
MKRLACVAAVLSLMACGPNPPASQKLLGTPPPAPPETAAPEPPKVSAAGFQFSGPFTHANLSVFLVHKPGVARDPANYLTLEEAFAAKTLLVIEKGEGGQVNSLEVENSGNQPIYLQAGDTVKGGKQDRTIAIDFVLQPGSGKQAVDAFCVEPGRWHARAGVPADGTRYANVFGAAQAPVATKEQKLAVKLDRDQSKVWEEGRKVNKDLAEKSAGGRSAGVPSVQLDSYVLTAEAPNVLLKTSEYTETLLKIVDGKEDVVGMAFAINGEPSTVEIYGGPALFRKLWPKLLKGASLEALSKKSDQAPARQASADDVKILMTQASDGATSTRDLAQDVQLETVDAKRTAIFETRVKGEFLHRQVLTK